MNKQVIALLMALILLLAGCAGKDNTDVPEQTAPETTTATVPATTAATIPQTLPQETLEVEQAGVEDSIFDDELPDATEPAASKPQNKPVETKPNSEKPSESTGNKENETTETKPAAPENPPAAGTGNTATDYEKFQAMSPTEQQKKVESFGNMADFFNWYNNAKAEYEAKNPSIEIGGGEEVDLEKLPGGNG